MRGQRHAPAALYPRERPGNRCTGRWEINTTEKYTLKNSVYLQLKQYTCMSPNPGTIFISPVLTRHAFDHVPSEISSHISQNEDSSGMERDHLPLFFFFPAYI